MTKKLRANYFIKGTVARDFWPLFFFHESTPYGPLIHTLKHFRILVRILEDIRFSKLFCGVSDPGEQHSKTNISEKFEKEFKNILGCEFGDYMGPIRGKNQRTKISCFCPFNTHFTGSG
jgi:hypothetical protein